MKLVIAEKPSVAMSLAAVLGATERKDGYLEGSGYLVSWCVGHLLELAQPEAYKEQYAKWRYEDLPILPENWKYEVPKDKKTQLALLCRLMKDKRVDSVVCATDAGREGELIFRLVYEYAGCKKPMERLWISSMEDAAIREGFDHLHPGSDYDKLYDAAVCRAGADWLIGINATRLFSVLYGVTLNVGRVMSPTLALLVQRESDIESFISKPFYVPEITCGGFTASGEKMTERSEAEKIRMDCDHNSAFVRSVEKQVKTIQPPRLYDLTTLQRECNRRLIVKANDTGLEHTTISLEKLVDMSDGLTLTTMQEAIASKEATIRQVGISIIGVTLFLLLFSIITFASTIITNIATKKREYAMFQSIGMTRKQTEKMALCESCVLAIGSLILTLILGIILGQILIKGLISAGIFYLSYTFPLALFTVYCIVVVLIILMITISAFYSLQKTPLVERLRIVD